MSFQDCIKDVVFEDIAVGRKGSVLVKVTDDEIPIVRTTSVYKNPVQEFSIVHTVILKKIKEIIPDSDYDCDCDFNNALIEIYDSNYTSMGFHSDQALDLKDESYICIYSCYENGTDTTGLRKLITKKKTGSETEAEVKQTEIPLKHSSVVIFSTDTNKNYLHKIILDCNHNHNHNHNLEQSVEDNRWLGITFRCSKTFVKFIDRIPYVKTGYCEGCEKYVELKHCTSQEKKEYYKYRSLENKNIEYKYPFISYSISPSDLLECANNCVDNCVDMSLNQHLYTSLNTMTYILGFI